MAGTSIDFSSFSPFSYVLFCLVECAGEPSMHGNWFVDIMIGGARAAEDAVTTGPVVFITKLPLHYGGKKTVLQC